MTSEIIRRIGPPAIPLLVDLLRHERESIRRTAADALIDLAPHTEGIQPAVRRALGDEDSVVAGDAARAVGALGRRASPSAGDLVNTLSHEDPYVRIFGSAAAGSLTPESDIDLLVLEDDPVDVRAVSLRIRQALRGLGWAFDIVVTTTERFDETKGVVGTIAYPAHRQGQVVYEAA